MKIDDRIVGLILIALGIGVFLVAQTFPLMAGMPYGPGFFPSIAAVGLVVCGLVITLSGALKAGAVAPAPAPAPTAAEAADTSGSGMLRPFLIALCVIFFGLAMPVLGFHITATITVAAVALIFGAGPLTAIVLAVAAAFATHAAFYSMLRVPLSWGVLTPYAW